MQILVFPLILLLFFNSKHLKNHADKLAINTVAWDASLMQDDVARRSMQPLYHLKFQNAVMPVTNLFGQPSVNAKCLIKEANWVDSDTKSIFIYNSKNQLIKNIESSDGSNDITNIEYNDKGLISRVTGFGNTDDMQLVYNQAGRLENVHVKKGSVSDKVSISYTGDKIVKVQYASGSITYEFNNNYNLIKATAEEGGSGGSKTEEAVFEIQTDIKNFLLSTGDFRFLSLLYGDYVGEGSYGSAGINFYKKFTDTDRTIQPATVSGYETEVQASNADKYPTIILFKFKDAAENYKMNITYQCN